MADPLPVLDLTRLVEIEHRHESRTPERQNSKMGYYVNRDAEGIERGQCSRCELKAVALVPTRWRKTKLGPVAEWVEACQAHADALTKISRRTLGQMTGVNPDYAHLENRMGRAPAGMTG